ncbi:unnamed protein product, partial [Discosporangium mesarthrocarpum]
VGRILPALSRLFGSRLWRVRAAVAEAMPALVSCTSCHHLKDEVVSLSNRMLLDPVDTVRRSAAEQLVVAACIDQDRCPNRHRHRHHTGGVCGRPIPHLLQEPRPRAGADPG